MTLIYTLLDDPFSAVDAETAAMLFNDCVMAALKDKTVILVTPQVEFLAEVDQILVMEGGQITQSGTYAKLLTTPGRSTFEQPVNAHKNAVLELFTSGTRNMDENQLELWSDSQATKESSEKEISVEGVPNIQLTIKEEIEIGDVGWRPVFDYLYVSKGSLLFSSSILSYFTFGTLKAAASYWLAISFRVSRVSNGILVGVFAGISMISIPFVYLNNLYAAHLGLKALKAFFSGINDSVFKSPMLFIDSTPMGRIFTQVSSDMSTLDFDLPTSIHVSSIATIDTFIIIAIMASVAWPVLFVAIPTVIVAKCVQGYYLSSAREFMRMNGKTKEPILNYAAETSQGFVGLSLSYALTLSPIQVYMTIMYCNLSNDIVSVERIKQFMHLPPEAPAIIEDMRPPTSWPCGWRIELHDLKVRYRPNAPLVLKGITCTFKEETRVGVVERTGSGKTTLISALFRLVDPASGRILIDGLDICSIGLKDLRTKLSIIPQEPTLFRGSIRMNLDPLGIYSDNEIWEALEKCQLKAIISGLPKLLDSSGTGFASRGELIEYDVPSKFMETNSAFSKLVSEYSSNYRRNSMQS